MREILSFHKNDHNLAKNTKILARSILSRSANFDPLVLNDGALKFRHQGRVILILGGRRDTYKKNP